MPIDFPVYKYLYKLTLACGLMDVSRGFLSYTTHNVLKASRNGLGVVLKDRDL